jgi:hypothetical protein
MDYTSFIQTVRSRLRFENQVDSRMAQRLQETGDLDEFIDSITKSFLTAPQAERAALSQMFADWEAVSYLQDYARRACDRILDHKDPEMIRSGLAATLIAGDRQDPRDLLYTLGHLYRVAQQAGFRDPMPLFIEVASLSAEQGPHSCAALMRTFNQTAVCQELAAIPGADLPSLVRRWDTIGLRSRLESGDNPNVLGRRDVTPLMLAAREGSRPMINLLLRAGAKINLCDESGWSALVYAAEQGRWAAVELLVANGAQTDVKPDGVPLDVFIQERAASRVTERGRKILCAIMNRSIPGVQGDSALD